MNKKVLWSMIILLWVFLIGFAVIKLFFADWFVAVVENDRILQIGNFIDSNLLATIIADIVVGIIIMNFYLCSCLQKWRLSLNQYLILVAYSISIVVLSKFIPAVHFIDLIAPIAIPILFKAKLSQSLCMFALHNLGQIFTLFVRGEPLYLASTNYATQFVLILDMYIWLIIYYIHSNLYREDGTLWENLLLSFSVIRRKLSLRKNLKE